MALDPATPLYRGFQAQYGTSPRLVRYVVAAPAAFEIGTGLFDGGSPGTIARVEVLASSVGGFLPLPAGAKDVFALPDMDREPIEAAGDVLLTPADLGCAVLFAGLTAGKVAALPPVASCPPGSGFLFANGSATASLTIDPNGAEQVNGGTATTLGPGEACEIVRSGTAWVRLGGGGGTSADAGQGAGTVNPTATRKTSAGGFALDFPLASGVAAFRLYGTDAYLVGTGTLGLQVSLDGGTTFRAGATDYTVVSTTAFGDAVVAPFSGGGDRIPLCFGAPLVRGLGFTATCCQGGGSAPFSAGVRGRSRDADSLPVDLAVAAGHLVSNGAATHLRVMAPAGFFGTFVLEALA